MIDIRTAAAMGTYGLVYVRYLIVRGRNEQYRTPAAQGDQVGVVREVQYLFRPAFIVFVDIVDTDDVMVLFQEVAQGRTDLSTTDETDIHSSATWARASCSAVWSH